MAAKEHIPTFHSMKLFVDLFHELQKKPQTLTQAGKEMGCAVSLLSNCVTLIQNYSQKKLVVYFDGIAKPTSEAESIVKVFEKIRTLATTLSDAGETKATEIRIVTTVSLKNRLFPGPMTAFTLYLQGQHRAENVKITVDGVNNENVIQRVQHGGSQPYHWGVCWMDPMYESESRDRELEFIPINYAEETDKKQFATPLIALAPRLDCCKAPEEFLRLFTARPAPAKKATGIDYSELLRQVNRVRTVHLREEPNDVYRKLFKELVEREPLSTRVDQYEDALFLIRTLQADLTFAPGWFRFRNHLTPRFLEDNGVPIQREIRLVRRVVSPKASPPKSRTLSAKKESPSRQDNRRLTLLDYTQDEILEFFVMFRAFLSDPEFQPLIVAARGESENLGQIPDDRVLSDPFYAVGPTRIRDWLNSYVAGGPKSKRTLQGDLERLKERRDF